MRLHTRISVLAASALLLAGVACGDDEPTGPTVPPEEVTGVYDPTVLTFDVQGQLPEKDILARVDTAIQPRLVIDTEGGFQLAFIDPATSKVRTVEGEAEGLTGGVRLTFQDAAEASYLLLPERLDLIHDAQARTLSFHGETRAPRARLRELVPEFEDEPLSDPVPGDLHVVFRRRPD